MSETSDKLVCELRTEFGTRAARRLRRGDRIPVNLYGHGEAPANLHVAADELQRLLLHGAHMVQLDGAVRETAFVREVQWDTFGTHVLHVDLIRVAASEMVEVELAVELRGEAPGIKEGGAVEHHLHQVTIECAASAVPEKLVVNINELHLDQTILAKDLELPEGARLLSDPEAVVVACPAKAEVEEEEQAPVDMAAEPEVIGRKPEEASEEE